MKKILRLLAFTSLTALLGYGCGGSGTDSPGSSQANSGAVVAASSSSSGSSSTATP